MDRSARILVVEDEGIVGLDIQQKLKSAGYDVPLVAASAEEALRGVESTAPDLVLMDIHIQGQRDGIETASAIREHFQLPVIFVTAHADEGTLNRARATEPFGYIVKPISLLSLTSSIEMALYKHSTDQRLNEHRAWLMTLLGSLPDAMIVTDALGKIEFLNGAAERLMRVDPAAAPLGELIQKVLPLHGGGRSDVTWQALQRALLEGSYHLPRETYLAFPESKNKIPVEGQITISSLGRQAAGAIFMLRDASAREMEDQQIRQEQKMLAVGQLASGVSNTFYGLFDIISSSNNISRQLVELETVESLPRILDEADTIERASSMGMILTRQLTRLGDHQALKPEPVDLNQVIANAAPLLSKLGEKPGLDWWSDTKSSLHPSPPKSKYPIDLEVDLCSEPATVLCHANHLEQMLLNVFVNARERLAGSGKIRISTEIVHGRREQVVLALRLERSDPAIPASIAFPFNMDNPDIDLSVANAIVTAAGGITRFEQRSDSECEIEVLLPLWQAPTEQPPVQPARQGVVLLVGMAAPSLTVVQENLEAEQFVVVGSTSAAEALFVARFFDGQIDAVVLDSDAISAHNRDRIRRAFSDRNPNTKFVCLTFEIEERDPAWRSILKPFQPADISKALR